MAAFGDNEEYIRDLKKIASLRRESQPDSDQAPRQDLASSRAAMLFLVDRLARRSLFALASMFGAAIFLATIYTITIPSPIMTNLARLIVWLLLFGLAFGVSIYRLRLFQRGYNYHGRPFTWQSHYASSLAILSTAFGASALFLTPGTSSITSALSISGGVIGIALVAGLSHLSHKPAALAISAPAICLAFGSGLSHITAEPITQQSQLFFIWAAMLAVVLAIGVWANAQYTKVVQNALRLHPRHEMMKITARQRKTLAGYNPFSFRDTNQKRPTASGLQAERAVGTGN